MGLLFRRHTVYVQRGHSRITLLLSYSGASAELTCSMTRVDYCCRAWCASDTGVIYGVIVSVPRCANAMMASMSVMSRRVYGAETVRLCDADGASRPPAEAVEPPYKSGDICRRRPDHPSRCDSSTNASRMRRRCCREIAHVLHQPRGVATAGVGLVWRL